MGDDSTEQKNPRLFCFTTSCLISWGAIGTSCRNGYLESTLSTLESTLSTLSSGKDRPVCM